MKKRFLIAVELPKEAESTLIAYFKENNAGWWHHIPNFWLVANRRGTLTAQGIRDKIKAMSSRDTSRPMIVMEIHEDITWAGLYAAGAAKNPETFDWLKSSNWKEDA